MKVYEVKLKNLSTRGTLGVHPFAETIVKGWNSAKNWKYGKQICMYAHAYLASLCDYDSKFCFLVGDEETWILALTGRYYCGKQYGKRRKVKNEGNKRVVQKRRRVIEWDKLMMTVE